MGISKHYTTERNKNAPKKVKGPFMITAVHQEGRFYRLSTDRAAHFENIQPHNPSTEDWCIPADMEEGDYLMMDPACEVKEKGTREKIDGNDVMEEGSSPPLDLDPYPTQKRTGKTPNKWRSPRIWNQTYHLRYRHYRRTVQDSRRSATLTEMTS